MKVDVQVERLIAAPVDRVSGYVADPANAPQWYKRISEALWESAPRVEVGGRVAFVARFLGRTLRYVYEITDYRPGERMTMQTSDGPFSMCTEYSWSSVGPDSTLMTLRNYGEPDGFARIVAPAMSLAMRRAMTQDLAALARIVEST